MLALTVFSVSFVECATSCVLVSLEDHLFLPHISHFIYFTCYLSVCFVHVDLMPDASLRISFMLIIYYWYKKSICSLFL